MESHWARAEEGARRTRKKKKQFPFCYLTLSIFNYVRPRLKNDFDAAITLHNESAWLNCGPCSRLGYLEVHSFAYQASRAHTYTHTHTKSSCLCLNINAFHTFFSPPLRMKISWLPERGHWTFPQYSQPERKGEGWGWKKISARRTLMFSLGSLTMQLTRKPETRLGIQAWISSKLYCIRALPFHAHALPPAFILK